MEKEPDIIQSFTKLGCKCSNNGYHLYDIQKWLREVKDIDITVVIVAGLSYGYSLFNRRNRVNDDQGYYNTYEKALEAGIWEAYFILNN